MMEPVVARFIDLVRNTPRQAPTLAWVSSLTGLSITDDQATDPSYWARQLREPVRFMDGLGQLIDKQLALVEVGPGQALKSLALQHDERDPEQLIVNSLHPAQDFAADLEYLLAAAGQLWTRGRDARLAGSARRCAAPPAGASHLSVFAPAALGRPGAIARAGAQGGCRCRRERRPCRDQCRERNLRRRATRFVCGQSSATSCDHHDRRPFREARCTPAGPVRQAIGHRPCRLLPSAGFLELGLDSLFLTQARNAIQKEFGAKIPLRELLEDCSTLVALAARLDTLLPPDAPAQAMPPAPTSAAVVPPAAAMPAVMMPALAGAGDMTRAAPAVLAGVFAQQLAIITRQLEILAAGGGAVVAPVQQPAMASARVPEAAVPAGPESAVASVSPAADDAPGRPVAFGPYRPPAKPLSGAITTLQEHNLKDFIERYNRKTAGSKSATAANRAHLADPRSAGGFRMAWKEMVYPIVSVRSAGSKLWDVDGNEYVDLINGFGMTFFGHTPDFVRDAVKAQCDIGYRDRPPDAARRRSREAGLRHGRHGAGSVLQHRLGGRHGGDPRGTHGHRPRQDRHVHRRLPRSLR